MTLYLGSCRPPQLLLSLRWGQEGEHAETPVGPLWPSQGSQGHLL